MLRYDSSTALLVTDLQNDFADPRGSLYVAGADLLLDRINNEIEAALGQKAFVLYTQDWHPPHTPHFAVDGGIWPVHCVAGSWGAEFLPGLVVAGPVIRKGTGGEDGYSGFTVQNPATGARFPTEMEDLIRARNIERLVLVGVATDYCVRETALDAIRLGFVVTVLTGAVRSVDQSSGADQRCLTALADAGAVLIR